MGQNLSASATEYTSLIAQGGNPTTTTSNGNATVNCSATLGALTVILSADPQNGGGTQTYAFTVMVNGVATANTCTVSQGATTCTSPASVALSAGSTVNIRIVPGATPTVVQVNSFFASYGAPAIGP